MQPIQEKSSLPPYLNKSLEDLPGEQWDMIPDFGDSYMVSSLGRVKSLSRTLYFRNGRCRQQKEIILSAGLVKASNHFIGDYTTSLSVTLWWEGEKKTFSIRRLVYHCFVEPIDLFSYEFLILCKDGNGLNLHYENLEIATYHQKLKQTFQRHRSVSCFAWLDMKAIVQSDLEGVCGRSPNMIWKE